VRSEFDPIVFVNGVAEALKSYQVVRVPWDSITSPDPKRSSRERNGVSQDLPEGGKESPEYRDEQP
jgi:hypothetical protein